MSPPPEPEFHRTTRDRVRHDPATIGLALEPDNPVTPRNHQRTVARERVAPGTRCAIGSGNRSNATPML
jgi:hypothetical protein